jgi:hypothetical protein
MAKTNSVAKLKLAEDVFLNLLKQICVFGKRKRIFRIHFGLWVLNLKFLGVL